ncbi:MAG TPA: plastocyanin/azurin family copper-binding protein [Ktedonobacteraceae bacterium]|jgi:plastocyanin|nr:plastocyanin/azurin family copper-binding protein [Ktedonobacteraceae bacterium]
MKNSRVKLFAFTLMILALVSVLLAACARPGSSSSNEGGNSASGTSGGGQSSGAASNGTVHMGDTNFLQSSVTISKGGKVTLIDDASVVHIIQNGSWDNGTAKPAKEAGAPTVQVNFQGNDTHDIGPFNTAGTFHVYCTVHPGMNLTITVQ